MSKKNILVVTPYPLYPARTGGRIGILSSIEPLSEEYNYHLIALMNRDELNEFSESKEKLLESYYNAFKTIKFIERPLMPFEFKHNKTKLLKHFWTHVKYSLPLMDLSYYNPKVIDAVRQTIRMESIDLIEIHHLHCSFVRRFFPNIPAIMINHNLESMLWPFFMKEGHTLQQKAYNFFGKISRRNAYRIEFINSFKFQCNGYVSISEMDAVTNEYGKKFWLPTSLKLNVGKKKISQDSLELLWVGGFDWYPNVEAIDWFLDEIWPEVKKIKNVRLNIIGANPHEKLRAFHDGKKIIVPGYVEDISEFWRKADAFIVPLKSGGGIRVKILEALNAGIPVISTSKGSEGLPYIQGEHLLIADDKEDFINSIYQLSDDLNLRQGLSENGRKYLEENHSTKVIKETKRKMYESAWGDFR